MLAAVQEAAAAYDLQIPLGLGSEGSATIGGLVSTNAGGVRALRHGVMRAQVLGLEVVLADGRVWNGLRTLLKNNMGYDMKQLFVGGEGTLGVVTAAALRLAPAWRQVETAIVGVTEPKAIAARYRIVVRRACMNDHQIATKLASFYKVAPNTIRARMAKVAVTLTEGQRLIEAAVAKR